MLPGKLAGLVGFPDHSEFEIYLGSQFLLGDNDEQSGHPFLDVEEADLLPPLCSQGRVLQADVGIAADGLYYLRLFVDVPGGYAVGLELEQAALDVLFLTLQFRGDGASDYLEKKVIVFDWLLLQYVLLTFNYVPYQHVLSG